MGEVAIYHHTIDIYDDRLGLGTNMGEPVS